MSPRTSSHARPGAPSMASRSPGRSDRPTKASSFARRASSRTCCCAGWRLTPREAEMTAKLLIERAAVLRAIRSFFEARGFLEVETPIVVPSPGLEVHLDAFATDGRYLSTSPE